MINKNNKNKIAELLNFKDYGTELYILKMLGARFINEQYPSKDLIKTYCSFHKTKNKTSEKKLERLYTEFTDAINGEIKIKKAFNDKSEITEKVTQNLEKFRDEIVSFDEFYLNKYSVVFNTIRGTGQVDSKPWKEYVQFLDKVNEYIKDKDLSDKDLLGIYTKQIPIDIEPIETEILGNTNNDSNFNSDFGE